MAKTKDWKQADIRTKELLRCAVALAEADGYTNITREAIAREAGVSEALVSARLGTMPAMRRAVMRAAVTEEVLAVVAQGLAARDAHAMKAPEALRRRAAEYLLNTGSL